MYNVLERSLSLCKHNKKNIQESSVSENYFRLLQTNAIPILFQNNYTSCKSLLHDLETPPKVYMVRYKYNITFSLGVCGKISTQYKPRLRLGLYWCIFFHIHRGFRLYCILIICVHNYSTSCTSNTLQYFFMFLLFDQPDLLDIYDPERLQAIHDSTV